VIVSRSKIQEETMLGIHEVMIVRRFNVKGIKNKEKLFHHLTKSKVAAPPPHPKGFLGTSL
jgi:hypothetical protein